jgi:hypothetical protein
MGGDRANFFRSSAGALVIALLSPFLPSAAADPKSMTPGIPIDTGIKIEMLRQLEELGAPEQILDLITKRDASVEQGRSTYAQPFPDLDGDGIAEVAEVTWAYLISVSDSQTDINEFVVEEVQTFIRIRRGTDGELVWKKRYDDFVVPVPSQIGAPARQGVLAVGGLLSFFGGSAGERYFTIEALDGKLGRLQWSREYRGVGGSDGIGTSLATNSPVSISLFQGLPGTATDVLVGLGDYVTTPLTSTVAVRTVVVDGKDGGEVLHTNLDVGVDWIPHPMATSDLDGDGLHDYVVANNPGVDPGGPQEPPSFGGVLHARRGDDGSEIWTTGGLTFALYAGATSLPNVVGNGTRDLGIVTSHPKDVNLLPAPLPALPISFVDHVPVVMLLDGSNGYVRWTKPGEWIFSPGDLTSDGTDDVVVERTKANKARIRYEQHAFTGVGKKIWVHDVTWKPEPCLAGACFRSWFGWGNGMGDVQPDSTSDTFVALTKYEDPGARQEKTYVMDGQTGRVLVKSDETLFPSFVAIDGKGSDLLTLAADTGNLSVTARRGHSGDVLWRTVFRGPESLLKKRSWPWASGFYLPGDRCGDEVVGVNHDGSSFYAIISGADGKTLWSFWSGAKEDRPTVAERFDHNQAC